MVDAQQHACIPRRGSVFSILHHTTGAHSLPGNIRPSVLENQLRLPTSEVKKHFCKVAVHPCEPRPCVGRGVVDVDGFVDQP